MVWSVREPLPLPLLPERVLRWRRQRQRSRCSPLMLHMTWPRRPPLRQPSQRPEPWRQRPARWQSAAMRWRRRRHDGLEAAERWPKSLAAGCEEACSSEAGREEARS